MILESPFSAPLRLAIPATYMISLLVIVPLLFIAIVVLWYTPIHWSLLLLVVGFDCAIAYYFLRMHYWQNLKSSVLEINQDIKGQWSVLPNTDGHADAHSHSDYKENNWQFVVLLKTSFVSTLLIVLNFQGENRRYTVIIPAGSLDEDTFRRLRVRVRVAFD